MNPNRATAVVFAVLAAILGGVVLRGCGPSPLPTNAPPAQFSAARAIAVLSEILGGDAPHPVGTPMHDAVRDRILGQFRKLGYETSVQQTFACNAYANCAPVANVIARLPGDARADTLVVAAHYDSAAAGPGASDDGIAVASLLEVARAIAKERFRNTVVFLMTDGEEAGLLGAEAFIGDPRYSRGIAAAINVDNRGTSGRSYLFETSRHNRWLLPLIARSLPRPVTSSLFYNLYELLPNDTDLSVFKHAGMAGINFAAIGNVAHYHTTLDDLRHVRPSTVQDHGDHILAMTRTFANSDLRQATDEDAVFFDLLSLVVLWWPQPWTRWMAAGALLVLLIGAGIRVRDGATNAAAITAGVLSFFLSVIAAAIIGSLVAWLATLRASTATWTATPGPAIAAMWLIGVVTAIVCAKPLYGRAGFDGLFIGHGLCWTAMAVALAVALPGGSYLAVVPAIAFALCTTLRATLDLSEAANTIITSTVTALLWFPVAVPLYDIMGKPTLGASAAILALVSTTFTPLVAVGTPMRRATVAAMITTAAACVGMQLLVPTYTAESPRRINVEYVDDGGIPRWQVDALTPRLRSAAAFGSTPHRFGEWLRRPPRVFTAPAPLLPITPPELQIVSDNLEQGRRVTVALRSTRGAERMALIFRAPELTALRINGFAPPQRPPKYRIFLADDWHAVTVFGAQAAEIEITMRRNEPIKAFVIDRSYALPQEAVPLARARDESIAVPSNDGDGVSMVRSIRF